VFKVYAAGCVVSNFRCNGNEHFPIVPASLPSGSATDDAIVDFNSPEKLLSPWPHHSAPQLMQTGPGRFVTAQPKGPLKAQGADPAFLIGHPPHGAKPNSQRQPACLEDRTCRNGDVGSAASAMQEPTAGFPCLTMLASRALESIGPAYGDKIVPTRLLAAKPMLKFEESPWILF
jgi:hypothetical protein